MADFEQQKEQPKDAKQVMGGFMPDDVTQLDDKKPKTKTETSKEDIDKASKGYPKVDPKSYPDAFKVCKEKAALNLNQGEKWSAGTVVTHTIESYNASDKQFHGNEYVLVTGNKEGEYHFFRSPEKTRKPTATEQKEIDKQAAANQKEASDLDEQDRKDTLAKLLKGSPEPVTVDISDPLAKKADKDLKLGKDETWTAAYVDQGSTRVVGFLTASGGKAFYKGEKKA